VLINNIKNMEKERNELGRFKKIYQENPNILNLRLSREQKLNCKLTDEDIQSIRELYKLGHSSRYLGKKFKVTKSTIIYWVNDEYRKKALLNHAKNAKKRPQRKDRHCKYYKRMKEIGFPINEKMRAVQLLKNREYRKNNPSKVNIKYAFNGKSLTLKEWSAELGVKYTTLYCRMFVYSFPYSKIFQPIP
jgi:transposase